MRKTTTGLMVTAAMLALAAPAYAAEPTKPAPEAAPCKTLDECQKMVKDLNLKVAGLTVLAQGLRQQRNSNAEAAADAQVNAFVAAQQPPAPVAAK